MYNDGGNDVQLRAWLLAYAYQQWAFKFQPTSETQSTAAFGVTDTYHTYQAAGISKVNVEITIAPTADKWSDDEPTRGLFGYVAWEDDDGFLLDYQKLMCMKQSFIAPAPYCLGFYVFLKPDVVANVYTKHARGTQYDMDIGPGPNNVNPVTGDVPFP